MSIRTFWLASNSPRRREMISWLGWSFRTAPSRVDESARAGEAALDYVQRIALAKSLAEVEDAGPEDIIIAADTIVVLDGIILGKPADAQNAREMLKSLHDRDHYVFTAISVRQSGSRIPVKDICRSEVHMRDYSDEEIEHYIQSGDPLDKAGAYAIQSPEFNPVVGFAGCYASVMGMPLCHLERTLRKLPGYTECAMDEICRKNLQYKCPIAERVLLGEDIG